MKYLQTTEWNGWCSRRELSGETENEFVCQADGKGIAARCEEVRDEVVGRNELLGKELTDQTVICVGLIGKMSGMRLVVSAFLTGGAGVMKLVMMVVRHQKYSRQDDRQKDKTRYVPLQIHADDCTPGDKGTKIIKRDVMNA